MSELFAEFCREGKDYLRFHNCIMTPSTSSTAASVFRHESLMCVFHTWKPFSFSASITRSGLTEPMPSFMVRRGIE